jgi:hypothetical protein
VKLRDRGGSEERKGKTEKEKEYFKMNEPKLMEISDNQRKLEMEEARYDRLSNLFNDSSKGPCGTRAKTVTFQPLCNSPKDKATT